MRNLGILCITLLVGWAAGCSKSDEAGQIPVTGVEIESALTLAPGENTSMQVTLLPKEATQQVQLSWSSSDSDVAAVDASGQVKALKNGAVDITVQVVGCATIQGTCHLTVSASTQKDPNDVLFFEDNKLAALLSFYDKNNDGKLQRWEAELVTELRLGGNNLASLKGIENFTALELLDCRENNLQALDVSQNLALKTLVCLRNQIEALDVSMLPGLQVLNCRSNRLSKIDVSQNDELVELRCGMNNGSMDNGVGITEVDVTANAKLEVLDAYYLNIMSLDVTKNPKLRWLDIAYCAHTLWDRQPITEMDLSCNPELEYFNCMGSVYPGRGMQRIDVTHNPKLKTLICLGNNIAALDVSRNPELVQLSCSHNPIGTLDVTLCVKIDTLSCEWNDLSSLDLTRNTALVYINCANNRIDQLDLSQTKVGYLLANDNRIKALSLGDTHSTPGGNDGKPYLYMKLSNNLIETLDLKAQRYLKWLEVADNRLSSLDLNGCPELHGLLCGGNRLNELSLERIGGLWQLHCQNNLLAGSLDLTSHGEGLGRISCEGNAGLETVYVWSGFKPEDTYFMGGVGTLPCYTKDAATNWRVKP